MTWNFAENMFPCILFCSSAVVLSFQSSCVELCDLMTLCLLLTQAPTADETAAMAALTTAAADVGRNWEAAPTSWTELSHLVRMTGGWQ